MAIPAGSLKMNFPLSFLRGRCVSAVIARPGGIAETRRQSRQGSGGGGVCPDKGNAIAAASVAAIQTVSAAGSGTN
jgi:hypothetical protein